MYFGFVDCSYSSLLFPRVGISFKSSRVKFPSSYLLGLQYVASALLPHEEYDKALVSAYHGSLVKLRSLRTVSRRDFYKNRRLARRAIRSFERSLKFLNPYRFVVKSVSVKRSIWNLAGSALKTISRPAILFNNLLNNVADKIISLANNIIPKQPKKLKSKRKFPTLKNSIKNIRGYYWFMRQTRVEYTPIKELVKLNPQVQLKLKKTAKIKKYCKIRRLSRWIKWTRFKPVLLIRIATADTTIHSDLGISYRGLYKTVFTAHTGNKRFHASRKDRRRVTLGKYLIKESYRLSLLYKTKFISIVGTCHRGIMRFAKKHIWRLRPRLKYHLRHYVTSYDSMNGCQHQKERSKKRLKRREEYTLF